MMGYVMCNPSTADAAVDDPTIRRCWAYARREGMGGLRVVNLFAWRATKPADLNRARRAGADIVGPENEAHQRKLFADPEVSRVVAAWGALSALPSSVTEPRIGALLGLPGAERLERFERGNATRVHASHPLYLPADARLVPYGVEL